MFFVLFLTFLLVLLVYSGRRAEGMPPGPINFPILGNLIQMVRKSKEAYIAFDLLAQEYGEIFTLRLGSIDTVVLSSYEAMEETMGKDAWSGRPWDEFLQSRYLNQRLGLIFLEGDVWKEQRRFALRHLRDFGFGKRKEMEKLIHDELDELTSRMKARMADGFHTVIYMDTFFNLSVLNVLWAMVAGKRYFHDDQCLQTLIQKTDSLFKSQKVADPWQVFPLFRKMFSSQEKEQVAIYHSLQTFFKEEIEKHRNDSSFGSSNHFIDVFLQEVDKTSGQSGHSSFSDDQLVGLCTDFFVAGSETTSKTLSFAILYMILHTDIQEKVHQEILSVVTLHERLRLDHRQRLPYTEAVMMEIQRMASIVPLTPPHRTTQSVSYRGYKIPKDTLIFLNLYSLNKSKAHWGDPEVFRPERFLSEQGELLRDDQLIPFGVGKRVCPGESLATMSLFLYFSTLMKAFKFETIPGHLDPPAVPVPGITLSPQPFNVSVTLRV